MRKSTSSFLTLAMVLWLLPLGAFIKPSQEKTACDGKRAFHMCSMMSGQAKAERPAQAGPAFDAPSSPAKASYGGESGNEFLVDEAVPAAVPVSRFFEASLSFRPDIFARPIDHIPLHA